MSLILRGARLGISNLQRRNGGTTQSIFEIRTSTGDFPYRNPLLNLPSGALLPTGEATNGVRILGTLLLRSGCSSTGRRGTAVVTVSLYFNGKVPSLEYRGQVYWSQ